MMNGETFELIQARSALKFEIETGNKMSATPATKRVLNALSRHGMHYQGNYGLNTAAGRIELYLEYNETLVENGFENKPLDVDRVRERLGTKPSIEAVFKEYNV